jgi:hypothetical protein
MRVGVAAVVGGMGAVASVGLREFVRIRIVRLQAVAVVRTRGCRS